MGLCLESKDNQRSAKLIDKLILISIPRLQPTFSVDRRCSDKGCCPFSFFRLLILPAYAPGNKGSTGCKQTPNGLFIFLFKLSSAALAV
jgi:hypothetical protein